MVKRFVVMCPFVNFMRKLVNKLENKLKKNKIFPDYKK